MWTNAIHQSLRFSNRFVVLSNLIVGGSVEIQGYHSKSQVTVRLSLKENPTSNADFSHVLATHFMERRGPYATGPLNLRSIPGVRNGVRATIQIESDDSHSAYGCADVVLVGTEDPTPSQATSVQSQTRTATLGSSAVSATSTTLSSSSAIVETTTASATETSAATSPSTSPTASASIPVYVSSGSQFGWSLAPLVILSIFN
jgi:hypothetical protein